MNRTESLETSTWVKGEKKHWSPRVKIILAFVLGLLALSPAILGIYWQLAPASLRLSSFGWHRSRRASQRSRRHKAAPGSLNFSQADKKVLLV